MSNPNWSPDTALAWLEQHLVTVIAIVAAVTIVAGLLLLLWTYVNSICRFILIDTLVERECRGIRAGWSRWRDVGRQYFVWQLVFQLVVFLTLLLVVGAFGGLALVSFSDDRVFATIGIALAGMFVLATAAIAAYVVYLLGKDFMAPILAIEPNGARQAWRTLLAMMRADKLGFLAYLGVKLLMAIALSLLLVLAFLLVALPVILLAMGVAGVWPADGLVWAPGTVVLAVLAGIFGLMVLVAAMAMLSVPLTVFFPAYGLHFLADRYPALDAWLNPSTPGPETGVGHSS